MKRKEKDSFAKSEEICVKSVVRHFTWVPF